MPVQQLPPMEYVKKGNLYFTAEVEDDATTGFGFTSATDKYVASDMPHGDRERFAASKLQGRKDLGEAAKKKILESRSGALLPVYRILTNRHGLARSHTSRITWS